MGYIVHCTRPVLSSPVQPTERQLLRVMLHKSGEADDDHDDRRSFLNHRRRRRSPLMIIRFDHLHQVHCLPIVRSISISDDDRRCRIARGLQYILARRQCHYIRHRLADRDSFDIFLHICIVYTHTQSHSLENGCILDCSAVLQLHHHHHHHQQGSAE